MSKEKLKHIEQAIDDIISSIEKKLQLREWKFQIDRNDENPQYNESAWKTVSDPTWATSEGTAFLRYTLEIPDAIEGIKIAGSDICITFIFPSGITIFVDEKQIYSQKFWADMRPHPLTIVKNAIPGSTHSILFKIPKGDGHGGIYAVLNIESVEDALFEILSIKYQLAFATVIAEKNRNKNLQKIIDAAVSQLSISDIEHRNWGKILFQIKQAEKTLEPFRKYARKINVHLIGHAHIDMNWLWTYQETKHVCVRDFTSMISLMEEFPDITFSQSQTHVYQIVEEENPSLFSKVQQKIRERRWEVTANAWVENDLNMSHGESITRHILYSRKYVMEKLGRLSPIMWSPDTFGHPATIPSILSDAGIKYYFHMRCGKDYPLYVWKGPDGSDVIAFKTVYNNYIKPDRIIPPVLRFMKLIPGVNEIMFPYGVGDHGGGPTRTDYKLKKKMEEKPVFPNLIFSTVEKYFKSIEKFRSKLPRVKGELNIIFEGCYTTHSDIKDINRKCEDALFALESAMAVFSVKKGKPDICEINKLEELWQKTLFNQFHDILCGSAIKAAYQYSLELGNQVVSDANNLIKKYVRMLPETGKDSTVIFNPVGWEISSLIKMQSENKYYLAEKIPGFGFITKDAGNLIEKSRKTIQQTSETTWETEFYTITFDRTTGTIKTLYDKKNKKLVLSIAAQAIPEDPSSWWAETSSNLISVQYEQPHRMSAWIIGNIMSTENLYGTESTEITEEPFRTIINVRRKYKNSLITQKTILYPDFPYIDFETTIDWNQVGNPTDGVPMVRTNFSFTMENPVAYYEIPFGSISRSTYAKEYPALRWAGIKEKNYWAGIITKNRHGFNATGNKLSLTLLRNAYEPDSQSDTGHHEIAYRLFFGRLNELEITKLASEFTMPPVVAEAEARNGEKFSPFEVRGNVLPICLKPSIDGQGIILRIVEMLGEKQKFTIKFDKKPQGISRVNITEEEISKIQISKTVNLTIPAYGIISLKIKY